MSHMIDESTGKAAIAYAGDVPWHTLGHRIEPGDSIETITGKAGLGYDVLTGRAYYSADCDDAPLMRATGMVPLYRSDTGALLSMVTEKYKAVQPSEVVKFIADICAIGGFTIETMGALSGGKRVWALARVHDGAPVVGHDTIRPYVLFATSYDATMATIAKFTVIRVVCNNTISMSVPQAGREEQATEVDKTEGAVVQAVRVPHIASFEPEKVRLQLGIVANSFERFLVQSRILAQVEMRESHADAFLQTLLSPMLREGQFVSAKVTNREEAVRSTRAYKRVMDLFDGKQIGADLAGPANRWAMLNAVTQWCDHERGRTPDSRMTSTWFGDSDRLKSQALALLTPTRALELVNAA